MSIKERVEKFRERKQEERQEKETQDQIYKSRYKHQMQIEGRKQSKLQAERDAIKMSKAQAQRRGKRPTYGSRMGGMMREAGDYAAGMPITRAMNPNIPQRRGKGSRQQPRGFGLMGIQQPQRKKRKSKGGKPKYIVRGGVAYKVAGTGQPKKKKQKRKKQHDIFNPFGL